MADAPEAPGRRKFFDVRKPGPKEYVIVGLGTIGAYLLVSFLKGRKAASSAAQQDSTADDQGTGTGEVTTASPAGGAAAFWLWLQDHAGGSTTTRTTSSTTGTATTTATVPSVVGERGETARAKVSAVGFKPIQVPATTPKGKSTTVKSQNPAGGTKAAKGTDVALEVAVT